VIQLVSDESLQQLGVYGSVSSQHHSVLFTEVVDGLGWKPPPPQSSQREQPRIVPVTIENQRKVVSAKWSCNLRKAFIRGNMSYRTPQLLVLEWYIASDNIGSAPVNSVGMPLNNIGHFPCLQGVPCSEVSVEEMT
jgi:hypothetical protein